MGDKQLKLLYSLIFVLISALVVAGYYIPPQSPDKNVVDIDTTGKIQIQKLYLHTSLDDAKQAALDENKPLFIYAHSETCGWCKKFEAETFTDKKVISTLNANFVIAALNIYEDRHVTAKYAVRGTPTMIFLHPDGEEITRIRGYVPTDEFIQQITRITI